MEQSKVITDSENSQNDIIQEKKTFFPWFKKKLDINISNYLDINLVFFLDNQSSYEVIDHMIDGLYEFEIINEKEIFRKAIIEREKIVSTGIGMGVAVPHAKLSLFNDFFIAIGIKKGNGISWNSIDKTPVRIIFMIGGPEDKQNEYLQILSHLTRVIKDESLRKKMISAENTEEIIKLLSPF